MYTGKQFFPCQTLEGALASDLIKLPLNCIFYFNIKFYSVVCFLFDGRSLSEHHC